jgi:non-ribosomal peptide synthetase component F
MLISTLREPGSGLYVEQRMCDLEGDLDPVVVRTAWQLLADRHPVLRTSVHWEGVEHPVQVVHASAPIPMTVLDRSEGYLREEFVREDALRGFDLTRSPLMRVTLVHEETERWFLLWTFHHIVLDGWSAAIVLREFFTVYGQLGRGEPPVLQDRPLFSSFIRSCERSNQGEIREFWRTQLDGFGAPTALPWDTIGPEDEDLLPVEATLPKRLVGGRYQRLHVTLPGLLSRRVEQTARAHRLTSASIYTAAWATQLHQLTGDRDIVFGSAVSGRAGGVPGAEEMVGLLLNTVPLRLAVDPNATFPSLARACQAALGDVEPYEQTPLVKLNGWLSRPHHLPLFHSLIVVQNFPFDGSMFDSLPGVRLRDLDFVENTNLPLSMMALPAGRIGEDGLVCGSFDTRWLSGETVARTIDQYIALLDRICRVPDSIVGQLSLPSVDESTVTSTGKDENVEVHDLIGLIQHQVAVRPDDLAVSGHSASTVVRLTFGQLWSRVEAIAVQLSGLASPVVGPVLVQLADDDIDLPIVLIACLLSRKVWTRVHPQVSADALTDLGNRLHTSVWIGRADAQLAAVGGNMVMLDLDDQAVDGGIGSAEPAPMLQSAHAYIAEDLATGTTWAIPVGHLTRQVNSFADAAGLKPCERFIHRTSAVDSPWELLAPLVCGAHLDLVDDLGPTSAFLSDSGTRVNLLALNDASELPTERTLADGTERLVLVGSASVNWLGRLRAIYPNVEVRRSFAHPLAGIVSTWTAAPRQPIPVRHLGRPLADARVRVLNGNWLAVPPGAIGELTLCGENLPTPYGNKTPLAPFGSDAKFLGCGLRIRLTATGELMPVTPRPISATERVKSDEANGADDRRLTDTEQLVAKIWSDLLEISVPGRTENFFALGGDSMSVLQVRVALHRAGWIASLGVLHLHPTVTELAAYLDESRGGMVKDGGTANGLAKGTVSRRSPVTRFPLTATQEEMVREADEGAPYQVYLPSSSYELEIPWQEDLFRASIATLTARHELLRASLHQVEEHWCHQIHDVVPIALTILDLRGTPEPERSDRASRWWSEEQCNGFKLDEPGLIRWHAVRMSASRIRIGFVVHHAVIDGWSEASLLAALWKEYQDRTTGNTIATKNPPSGTFDQYVGVVQADQQLERSLEFWRGTLDGVAFQSFEEGKSGGRCYAVDTALQPDLCAGLRIVARELGTNLRGILLAAHVAVIEGLAVSDTGRHVVSGLVIHGRGGVDDDHEVVGNFLNLVPLVLDRSHGSWGDRVTALARAEAELVPHRLCQFPDVRHALGCSQPFEALFNFVHYRPVSSVSTGDTSIRPHWTSTNDPFPYPLVAHFRQDPFNEDSLTFALNLREGFCDLEHSGDLIQRYLHMLENIIAEHLPRR